MGVESGGGGTGGRVPRSLKISGGRPSRNDISVSFFRYWEYPSTVANLEAFLINYHQDCQNYHFECRKIKLPTRVRKNNPAR